MTSFATSLTTALNRAVVSSVVDSVAQDGLRALNAALEDAGFRKAEGLKNYEVFSHATGNTVLFEIVLDLESVEAPPQDQADAAAAAAEILESEIDKYVVRTYAIAAGGGIARVSRMKDARRPARDARTPARDARTPARDARRSAGKTASSRKSEHDAARERPRSLAGMKGIRVTKEGKVSLAFEKVMAESKDGSVRYPSGQFDGVMKGFMDRLKKVVVESFLPELEKAIARYGI
ncbi:MAG: hypothetical protein BWY99_02322 [Synergistetes bacterium ADurb.BinA166]|nr:MAG: hypothetical protein BWY99_02322 [Synergistetes bacterium ADurb.BinA166]